VKQKNSKNTKKSDDSNMEILDIDQQIEETESEEYQETFNEGSLNLGDSKTITDQESLLTVKELYKQLEDKDAEYEKLHSRYLRALADYENLEKRQRTEKANFIKKANEEIILKLLNLADTFEKAEKSINSAEADNLNLVKDGFQAVHKQFNSLLKNEGVERINSIGEKFDPNLHEAVFVKATPDKEEETILEEVQTGYLLNSSLIRPTKVIIAKNETKGEK
jgi:molecular chaperone GrpE